jgi:hypothetical protein
MRKDLIVGAAATILLMAGLLAAQRAVAAPLTGPIGLAAAMETASHVEPVRYVCRRVWRCGPYGCAWRRVCWWQPDRYYYPYRPYRPYRYYYYRY